MSISRAFRNARLAHTLNFLDAKTIQESVDTSGNTGDIIYDNNFVYIKTTDGWKRASISSFATPSDISGLQLWLDASDASTLYDATTGGSLVAADGSGARWEDKSGNDRHATQGTAGARPLRKASVQNGLSVLRFDGADDFLSVPNSTATFNFLHHTQATVLIALKAGTTADPNVIYDILTQQGTGGSTDTGIRLSYDDRASASLNNSFRHLTYKGVDGQLVVNNIANNYLTANAYALVSVVIDNSALASERSKIRLNSGSLQNGNSATASASSGNASNNLTLGRTPGGSDYLNGDICEIIIYDSALSDTDREAVEDYLMTKWGIS